MKCPNCNSDCWKGVQILENRNRVHWILCKNCNYKKLDHIEPPPENYISPIKPFENYNPIIIDDKPKFKSIDGHLVKVT